MSYFQKFAPFAGGFLVTSGVLWSREPEKLDGTRMELVKQYVDKYVEEGFALMITKGTKRLMQKTKDEVTEEIRRARWHSEMEEAKQRKF